MALLLCVAAGLSLTAVLYLSDDERASRPSAELDLGFDAESSESARMQAALQSAELGDYDQAIATLESIAPHDTSGSTHFVLGRTQYEAGHPEASLETLDSFLAGYPRSSQAPLALLLRAEQRVDAGDLSSAAIDFAEYASLDNVASSYAFMRLGDIAAQSDDRAAAIDYYTRALGDGLSSYAESRLMLLLMELHTSSEQLDQATQWAERLIVSSPSTRDRVAAMEQLARLKQQAGDEEGGQQLANQVLTHFPGTAAADSLLSTLTDDGAPVSPIVQAGVLLSHGALAEAELLLLNTATRSIGEQAAEAAFHLGLLRELAGDPTGALAWFERSRPDDSADYLPELTLHKLESALITGDSHAADGLEQFALQNQGTVLAVSAVEALAVHSESRSDWGRAAELWLTASRLASKARASEDAVEFAQRAAGLFGEAGDAPAVTASLTAAALADPRSLDGIRAESGLDDPPALYVEQPVDKWLSEFAAPVTSGTSERLLAAGHTGSELRASGLLFESNSAMAETVSVARYSPAFVVELGSAAAAQGQFGTAARAAGTLLANLPVDLQREVPVEVGLLSYPRPYLETAEHEASSAGLDPLLLYALIRQESFFDPRARSSAQARGLTQIIPSTAQEIAATLGLEGFTDTHLYRPALSLAFGAYYLGAQLEAFDGYEYAALAAYNGGPRNARRWGESGGFDDPDVYLRQIDFTETSNYVRRVMENYAHYRALYLGEEPPSLPE